jgi:large subunit ribosomal protein L21
MVGVAFALIPPHRDKRSIRPKSSKMARTSLETSLIEAMPLSQILRTKKIAGVIKMFAIIEACGRQYQIEAGRFVDLDLTEANEGDQFQFDKVLMIVDGAQSTLGSPYIDGAKVVGRVVKNHKGKKIIVYHMKPKKGTRKKQGHRQHFTRIAIDSIELKDKVLAKAEPKETKAKSEPKTAEAKPVTKKAPEKKLDSKATKAGKDTSKGAAKSLLPLPKNREEPIQH